MAETFTNWSGSLSCSPRRRVRASTSEEVVETIRRAADDGTTVRPLGSGHSSMPIMTTDDVMLSADGMRGVVSVDREAGLARVLPGTGLADLGAELAGHDLGMENLGDVDYQSIAGAIGTGTHGTGVRLGNLSSTLAGGTLVTGTGEEVPFGVDAGGEGRGDEDDDEVLRAAQVSLGGLGVLTSLTLRVLPAYQLHRTNWMTHVDWVLDNLDELIEQNRHLDFYWYPRSDLAQVRILNRPGEEPELLPPGELRKDETGPSYEILPNDRELYFDEMEYMLPLEVGPYAFREARERIKERHRQYVGWRVLVRTVAPDRAMLSPSYRRPTMTIALLQNASLPYESYFRDMEPLMLDHGGRPHWGKKHTRTAEHLAGLYPEWDHFARIRERFDPDGVLLNGHLRELLGTDAGREGGAQ
ncbi:D-arabinono-1,4-lactone oxidase [Dietzia maris]|uniref:D-arabinono-1,4-lactone oxidase n=1 Tax=Dietzia maris TaxID=37915 RepID=UPI0021AFD21A|nr:D-arabinono-1,4-lactone oxidase [Dietzia maris]MCT1434100.1 FAD-binding protein [Dietzia maris]MCT1520652.1 FAD-binding protein [Dietzia maris]